MGLRTLKATHFRCLDDFEVSLDPSVNVVVGPNGCGKTSFLESIFFLSRGRSFRAPQTSSLIQRGKADLTVFGEIDGPDGLSRIGIRAGNGAAEIHLNGEGGTIAALAAAAPVQIIEPEIHQLVQGGPDKRRQYMDWGVFHVEHHFLLSWRRYRRALKQRNAALRSGSPPAAVRAFDPELVETGLEITVFREKYVANLAPQLRLLGSSLAGFEAEMRYRPGWSDGASFAEALASSWERDRALGSTQVGPHRADIQLIVDETPARHRISRGQQKLLGAAMVIAQSCQVVETLKRPVILLVDEPAAELDARHLERLIGILAETGLQLILSTLDTEALPLVSDARKFHVEHGSLTSLL